MIANTCIRHLIPLMYDTTEEKCALLSIVCHSVLYFLTKVYYLLLNYALFSVWQ